MGYTEVMQQFVPSLLIILLAFSLACSSTGSGTIRKDIYGNITGNWRLVVDDNGYVTYIFVEGKPGVMTVDENGSASFGGAYAGEVCDGSARLALFEREKFYTVQWITPCRFRLVPLDGVPPYIIAERLRIGE